MGGRVAAEDEKQTSMMLSLEPKLAVSNATCAEGGEIQSFYRVNDLGAGLLGVIDLTGNTLFNSAKRRGQAVSSDTFHINSFDKVESIQVSIPRRNTENWGESYMADGSPRTDISTEADTDDKTQRFDGGQSLALLGSDSSDRSKDKMDQKTLRRLAQNREAARKSRLRKKAYVQQLESSRLKLTQLEQELQRARQQGIFISSSGDQAHTMSGNGDAELRIIIDGVMAHYEDIFRLKSNAAKADVFHLLSGMWKTPAERCFLWLGGFRSSELLKLLVNQLEPLTEQQVVGIGNLQQSSQQAEDALSQGMEALQQSLAETLSSGSLGSSGTSGNVANYMGQMAMAMGKLGTLEGFIRQADNLRQQTLQQMHRILTTRQSARALLAIHDYFTRLRALSSLWLARPRE